VRDVPWRLRLALGPSRSAGEPRSSRWQLVALDLGLDGLETMLTAPKKLPKQLARIGIGVDLCTDQPAQFRDVGAHRVEHLCDVQLNRRCPVFDGDYSRRKSSGCACSS
jgi:hypothetical protein